jgi:hypothetical protein
MSLVEEQSEFLDDVTQLLNFARSLGFVVTAGEFYRTPEF